MAVHVGIDIIVIYNAVKLIFVQVTIVNTPSGQLVLYHLQLLPSEETIQMYSNMGTNLIVLDKYVHHYLSYIFMHWFTK